MPSSSWHLLRLYDLLGKAVQGVLWPPQRTTSGVPQLTSGTCRERSAVPVGFCRGLGLGSSWVKVLVHYYYLQLQILSWNEMPEQGPIFQRLFFRLSYWFRGVIWLQHSTRVMKVKFWFVTWDGPRGYLNLNTSCPGVCIVQKRFWCSRSILLISWLG